MAQRIIITDKDGNTDTLAPEYAEDLHYLFSIYHVSSATPDELFDMAMGTFSEWELEHLPVRQLLRDEDIQYYLAVE